MGNPLVDRKDPKSAGWKVDLMALLLVDLTVRRKADQMVEQTVASLVER